MAIYENLKIKQNCFGGIELCLDDEPIKGCKACSLDMQVDSIPELTVTVMVQNVEVELGTVSVTQEADNDD